MASHYEINPDESGLALRVAQRALRVANGLATARPGNIFIPNKDGDGISDGTGTWIGSGAVGNGGVAPWVGDTTPPGKPTGVSATSAWGTVYAKWDGTLEGGVPEDFAYVEVAIDGVVVGRITEAGTVAVDGYEDGHEATVAFVAYDAARDRTGALSPNASDAAIVQVTVSNERDAIDEAVKEANDKADALQQEVTDVKATVSGVEQDVTELSSQVSGAVEKADQSLSVATEAKQTADAISDTAERAYEDAQSALTQASNAVQTATQLQTTVEEDYLSKDEATGTYASKSDVTQTASDILSTVESEYQSKDGMGSYYTKTEVDQKNGAITSTVSEAVATADGAYEKATTVEQTVDGFEARITEASDKADEAINAAGSVNLIENSSFELGTTNWVADSGTMTVEDDSDYIHHLKVVVTGGSKRIYSNTSNVWVSGRTYSYSFYIRASSSGSTVTPSRSGIDVGQKHTVTTSWQRITGTIVSTDTVDTGTLSLVFSSTSATYYIARVKLEVGESATPWSSSPIDFGEASKTATNYLGFSSSGLVVGTNSSGTGQSGLQGNVRLTSGGMEVRSGSTVLARYGASQVELGVNSTSSQIKMCGGDAVIKVANGLVCLENSGAPDYGLSIGGGGAVRLEAPASSDFTALLQLLESGDTLLRGKRLDLVWDSNGIRGMVMQQIWSGSWITGSITVNDIGNYNMLVFACSSGFTEFGIAVRYPGSSRFIAFSMNPRSSLGFTFDTAAWTVSGTRVTKSTNAHATLTGSNGGTGTARMSQNTGGVYRIWGVL